MPRTVQADYYRVLGVSPSATDTEIKSQFRRRIREAHPDLLGPDAAEADRSFAEKLTKELNEAWEWLSNSDGRRQVDLFVAMTGQQSGGVSDWWTDSQSDPWVSESDYRRAQQERPKPPPVTVPDPERVEIKGVWLYVEYDAPWGYLYATVSISIHDIFKLSDEDLRFDNAHLGKIKVVDGKGETVSTDYSLRWLQNQHRRLLAEARRNADRRIWRPQIEALRVERDKLAANGLPTAVLGSWIHKAQEAMGEGWYQGSPRDEVIRYIREAEKELERLRSLPFSEVAANGLLAGSLYHPDHQHNLQVIERLRVLEIRSGGEVKYPRDDELHQHYLSRLAGVTSLNQFRQADLKLTDDEPLIQEMIQTGLLELAPETIEVQGPKRPKIHPVEYGYMPVHDQPVPVGIVVVTQAIYEHNGWAYGRKSTFPSLPFGIQLWVRVTVGDLVTDPKPDGPELASEVKRCLRRQQRVQARTARGGTDQQEPPPWFVGRPQRW